MPGLLHLMPSCVLLNPRNHNIGSLERLHQYAVDFPRIRRYRRHRATLCETRSRPRTLGQSSRSKSSKTLIHQQSETSGLPGIYHGRPYTLSRGMCQRHRLCRCHARRCIDAKGYKGQHSLCQEAAGPSDAAEWSEAILVSGRWVEQAV